MPHDRGNLVQRLPEGDAIDLLRVPYRIAALLVPASLLLIAPAVLLDGLTALLPVVAAAAAGVCVALAMLGLAIGLWVRDNVRGLLVALGTWFTLLCGIDLALLAVSGSGWVQAHPEVWVAPVMLNPLSALRVTMMFALEGTAAASLGSGAVVGWWLEHGVLWLAALTVVWIGALFGLGVLGARRRLDL